MLHSNRPAVTAKPLKSHRSGRGTNPALTRPVPHPSGDAMNNLKWLSVLCLATACGAANTAQDDSDTDDLSSATVSMEMVRANHSLAPQVVVPTDVKVNGRARPVSADDARELGGIGGNG